jgi:hypothetical protein
MNVVPRFVGIFLRLWLLSTVTGCAVGPSRYETPSYGMYGHYGEYQGSPYEPGIDYEKKMNKEEREYRSQRNAQEREQELKYQQWKQEREREQDPRWER